MKHYGYFDKQGKLHAESFKAACEGFRARGASVVFTVEEFKDKRSNQANRYYHGVVVHLIADALKDAGWEPSECTHDAVHEMLKRRFLTVSKRLNEEEYIDRTRSTTELDKEEFSAYIEHCVQFAAEYLSTVIPPPGEQQRFAA